MDLRLFRHFWGVQNLNLGLLDDWEKVGYRGLEIPGFQLNNKWTQAAHDRGWQVMAQIFSDGWNYSHDVDVHVASFKEQVEKALEVGADRVNCYGGEDAFSDAQAIEFFTRCEEFVAETGADVVWETHRGRAMFNPWRTAAICAAVPSMRLCLDFSHWTCVCERLINDCDDTLQAAVDRVGHVHARVGSSQAPQVTDPRAPEHKDALEWFQGWWQKMWDGQLAQGAAELSICPEFGPIPYMPSQPYTMQPVADLPQVCDWMAAELSKQFA